MSEFLIVKPPRGRAKIIFDLEIVEPNTDGTSEWSESSGIADSDDDDAISDSSDTSSQVSYISDPGISFESPDETSASDSDDDSSDSSTGGSESGEDTEDDDSDDESLDSPSESLAEGESHSDSDDDAPAAPNQPKFFIPKHHLEMIESGEMSLEELKKLEHTDLLRVATHPKMAAIVEKEFGLRGVYLLNHITIRPHQLYVLKWMKDIRDKFLAGPDPLEGFSKKKSAARQAYSAYHDPKSPDYGWEMKGPIASPTMGLGKTLMAIVDTLSTPKVTPYATLVVVSKTVMNVWRLQTRNFFGTGPTAPKILFLHSQYMTPKEIAAINRQTMKEYEFVITTYDFCKGAIAKTISKSAKGKTDGKTKRSFIIDECITYGDEHTLMKGKIESVNLRTEKQANRPEWTGPLVLYGTPFERVIADESQRFTNPDSDTFQAMMALYGKFKLCLTATSIKNKGLDRWCQYRFLGYSGVREKKIWKESGEKYNQTHGMNRFVMEMSLDDAGIELPPKYENDIYLTLVGMELEVADIFNKRAKSMYEQHLQKLCSSACILAMLQKLRLASIAPCLTLASAARLAEQKRIKAGKALAKKGDGGDVDAEDAEDDAEADAEDGTGGKKAPKRKTDDPPIDFEALVTGSEQGKWIADRKGTAGIRSAKMLKLIELLKSFPPGEKTVIFSTFTMALDLVEEALEEFLPSGKYQRIDGGTEGPDRERALHDFTYNPKCLWMLMTLKVGGEGIDLTVARKTVLLDPWWNTSAQDQAKARTYRCGQLRPTYMFSFYILDSVEQRVLKICNEKKDLIDRFSTGRTKRGAKDEKIDLGKLFA